MTMGLDHWVSRGLLAAAVAGGVGYLGKSDIFFTADGRMRPSTLTSSEPEAVSMVSLPWFTLLMGLAVGTLV